MERTVWISRCDHRCDSLLNLSTTSIELNANRLLLWRRQRTPENVGEQRCVDALGLLVDHDKLEDSFHPRTVRNCHRWKPDIGLSMRCAVQTMLPIDYERRT